MSCWLLSRSAAFNSSLRRYGRRSIFGTEVSHRLYVSSEKQQRNVADQSAASLSRAPFQMPKNSVDDSVSSQHDDSTSGAIAWTKLGLLNELGSCLATELDLQQPTPVQQLVIPALLQLEQQDQQHGLAFLAATGSGKTLAYLLPLLQMLKAQELFSSFEQRSKRPRLLILAPTRELAVQIKNVVKSLGHSIKLSSQVVVGGQEYGKERKQLDRPIDVLIATPGRLLKHWKTHENIFLGNVDYVVLDEMDTMLEQGFQNELKQLLYPLLYNSNSAKEELAEKAPKIVLTSATMTQQVQKMFDASNFKQNKVGAKRHYTKPDPDDSSKIALPQLRVITAPGLHRAVPRLRQVFVPVGNMDKLSLLVDVVSSRGGGAGAGIKASNESHDALCLVFCNTVSSCRAVQHALAEADVESVCYHGELNSKVRSENLDSFRARSVPVLVATDLAARGLDVPEVDHVVMFDFPLNPLDYLHRAGRTARGVSKDRKGNGRVTALVAKRDIVLAKAIENAVQKGEPLDGLTSRKSDYNSGRNDRPPMQQRARGGRGGQRNRGSLGAKGNRRSSGSQRGRRR